MEIFESNTTIFIHENEMKLKLSSAKWWPFCLGLNVSWEINRLFIVIILLLAVSFFHNDNILWIAAIAAHKSSIKNKLQL